MPATERKIAYAERLSQTFNEYSSVFLVGSDNVGSKQIQQIRRALRGKAVMVFGKNTLIRRVIRSEIPKNPSLEKLLPHVYGNVGFVFTNADLSEVRSILVANRVPAAARAGAVAPVDVHVPAGPTNMDPSQTSFLQALNIPSKIAKGKIEIVSSIHLIKKGRRVAAGEAALLQKLEIRPFTYGLEIEQVYDNGAVYGPEVLDMTQEVLLRKVSEGLESIAALSLQIGYPTLASVPHSVVNGFKNVLALALGTDKYSFPHLDKAKAALSSAAAAPAPVAAAAPAAAAASKKEEKAAPVEEEEEDFGMDLFG